MYKSGDRAEGGIDEGGCTEEWQWTKGSAGRHRLTVKIGQKVGIKIESTLNPPWVEYIVAAPTI